MQSVLSDTRRLPRSRAGRDGAGQETRRPRLRSAPPGPIAVLVGAEQSELSEEWMKQSSINVKIPMLGKADSLNVATATTLLLYEAVRQRQQ